VLVIAVLAMIGVWLPPSALGARRLSKKKPDCKVARDGGYD